MELHLPSGRGAFQSWSTTIVNSMKRRPKCLGGKNRRLWDKHKLSLPKVVGDQTCSQFQLCSFTLSSFRKLLSPIWWGPLQTTDQANSGASMNWDKLLICIPEKLDLKSQGSGSEVQSWGGEWGEKSQQREPKAGCIFANTWYSGEMDLCWQHCLI